MGLYICCCAEREDRACVTPFCACCSATCVSANWVMTMVGVVLAIALIALPISFFQILAWTADDSLAYPDQVDTNFFWITYVFELAQQLYDVGVMGTIFVTMWIFRGPARRNENEPKRVGTPLHRKNVIVFTVLVAIAMVMNAVSIAVFIIWKQITEIPGLNVLSSVLVLVFDMAWYVWQCSYGRRCSMPANGAAARARSRPSSLTLALALSAGTA